MVFKKIQIYHLKIYLTFGTLQYQASFLAQAVGVPVIWRSGGQLAMALEATLRDIISSPFFLLAQAVEEYVNPVEENKKKKQEFKR